MAWTDRIREGARNLADSEKGKELMQKARAKAEEGLDKIFGGRKREGEQLVAEAKQDAEAAHEAKTEPGAGAAAKETERSRS